MKATLTTLLLAVTAAPALAHPGHDHGSLLAFMEHAVWLAPLALAVVAAVAFSKKQSQKS